MNEHFNNKMNVCKFSKNPLLPLFITLPPPPHLLINFRKFSNSPCYFDPPPPNIEFKLHQEMLRLRALCDIFVLNLFYHATMT